MNKSFLQFQLPFMENLYQRERLENYVFMEKIITIMLAAYACVRFVSSVIFEETTLLYWELGFLFYTLGLLVLTFKGSPDKIKAAFTLTNNLFCLLQIYCSYYTDHQRLYLNGQNVMAFNMIFFYFTSISEAPIQILIYVGSRILIQSFINSQFVTQQFFEQIITGIAILVFIYCIDKISRNQFILGFTDKQWEQSLQVLVQSPFLIFTFDKERLNFNLRAHNYMKKVFWNDLKTGSENLRLFLRSYKVENDTSTLEQYIVNRMKSKNQIADQMNGIEKMHLRIRKVDISQEQNKLLITFSQFYLNQQVFLIVFDQFEQQLKGLEKVKVALIKGINQHQQLTLNFLRKQLSLIQISITGNRQMENLYKLKIHCMYFIGKYIQCNSFQEVENQISQFNLTGLIKQLIQTYDIAYNHFSIELSSYSNQDIIITTNENLINIFFIIIFQILVRLAKTNETIIIHTQIMQQEDQMLVQISILFRHVKDLVDLLSNNQIFTKIQTRISPNSDIKQKNEAAQFLLYLDLSKLNDIRMLEEEIE